MSLGHIVQWLLNKLFNDYWTHCPMVIGHIVQWLLETLSNDYWTHCPMVIGHIVQWLLDKLSNKYRTESKVSKEYSTLGPPNIGQFNIPWTMFSRYIRYIKNWHIVQWLLDTLSNDYWTHCPMTIVQIFNLYWTESKVNSLFHGQCVQGIENWTKSVQKYRT